MTINAHCQPNATDMPDTITGDIIAPTVEPELNSPVAKALSFLGNHSATLFTAAGKLADSPNPRAKRADTKPITLLAVACAIAEILQITIAHK